MDNDTTCICIGINYFRHSCRLNGCINDSESMIAMLKDHGYTNFIHMTDGTKNQSMIPRKENIISAISNVKTSNLIFTYAGHGYQNDQYSESLVCEDKEFLSDKDLLKCFRSNKNIKHIVAIFDCCHSGSMVDLAYKLNSKLNTIVNDKYYKSDDNGLTIKALVSSEPHEVSAEMGSAGILTMSITKVYNKYNINKIDGLSITEIINELNSYSRFQHGSYLASVPFEKIHKEKEKIVLIDKSSKENS